MDKTFRADAATSAFLIPTIFQGLPELACLSLSARIYWLEFIEFWVNDSRWLIIDSEY